jgi:hypothetical protein
LFGSRQAIDDPAAKRRIGAPLGRLALPLFTGLCRKADRYSDRE